MSTYATLQKQLQNYVLSGERDVLSEVMDGPRLDALGRLDVYATGYQLRLIEILDADYPALHVLAGDDLFDQLARAYIAAHPSVFPNARWFGLHLPQFLAGDAAFSAQTVLAEMARFEWAMNLAFDCTDDPILDIAELASLPGEAWSTVDFQLHSSMQRVELAWNVPAFWQAVTRAEDPPIPAQSPNAAAWMVWRRELTIYFRSLETDEAAALEALQGGGNFARICEILCDWHEPGQVPTTAMALLKRWIDEGLISGLRHQVSARLHLR
ncbi:MAG: DNA-binding domain-containing protein [Burkholderiales bacterium]|nr:DNA-binding domain-containing protein [Burkholderiales bacterium]